MRDNHSVQDKTYLFECWYCNEYVVSENKKPKNRIFHEECRANYISETEATKQEYVRLKIEVMYERALRMIEKQQGALTNNYKEAGEVVLSLARKDSNKFASSHEMVAAMELIRHGIKTKMQYPVNRRRVDMLLPDLKIALEIDGHLHKTRIGKDSERDIEIMNVLNADDKGWEIIRVPTKQVEERLTKLVPLIKRLYKERQDLRRKYNGFLPSYYSKHNRSAQIKALEGVNDSSKYSMIEW